MTHIVLSVFPFDIFLSSRGYWKEKKKKTCPFITFFSVVLDNLLMIQITRFGVTNQALVEGNQDLIQQQLSILLDPLDINFIVKLKSIRATDVMLLSPY